MADPAVAAELFAQGKRCREGGDLPGAEAAWRAASQESHHEAALHLGQLLAEKGGFEGAADEWAFAAGAPDPSVSVAAVLRYGRLISELEFNTETVVGRHRNAKSIQRDVPEADRLWRRAAESGHEEAAWGWIGLGRLYDPSELADEPDPGRSEDAFQRAAASDHPDAGPCGQLKLGRLRREVGDQDGAVTVLMAAAASAHREWGPRAAFDLGRLYANQGDADRAEHWWQVTVEYEHPDLTEIAQRALTDPNSPQRAGLKKPGLLARLWGG